MADVWALNVAATTPCPSIKWIPGACIFFTTSYIIYIHTVSIRDALQTVNFRGEEHRSISRDECRMGCGTFVRSVLFYPTVTVDICVPHVQYILSMC
ncbi:unnamed protein product [Dicrocoelium dendriticum]|nr:unnamed protein product [Dicrocoelium dendriticum]